MNSEVTPGRMAPAEAIRARRITAQLLSGLLTIVFLGAGIAKIADAAMYTTTWATWGYPLWSRYAVGAFEIACAIGLWIPRLRALSALGLVITMIGATYAYLAHAESQRVLIPTLLLVLAAVVAYLQRHELRPGARRAGTPRIIS